MSGVWDPSHSANFCHGNQHAGNSCKLPVWITFLVAPAIHFLQNKKTLSYSWQYSLMQAEIYRPNPTRPIPGLAQTHFTIEQLVTICQSAKKSVTIRSKHFFIKHCTTKLLTDLFPQASPPTSAGFYFTACLLIIITMALSVSTKVSSMMGRTLSIWQWCE